MARTRASDAVGGEHGGAVEAVEVQRVAALVRQPHVVAPRRVEHPLRQAHRGRLSGCRVWLRVGVRSRAEDRVRARARVRVRVIGPVLCPGRARFRVRFRFRFRVRIGV